MTDDELRSRWQQIAHDLAELRALLEQTLDEAGWPWCRRMSLLLDELISREEAA